MGHAVPSYTLLAAFANSSAEALSKNGNMGWVRFIWMLVHSCSGHSLSLLYPCLMKIWAITTDFCSVQYLSFHAVCEEPLGY